MLSYMSVGIRAVSTEPVVMYMYCQGALRLLTTDIGLSLTCYDISSNIIYLCSGQKIAEHCAHLR